MTGGTAGVSFELMVNIDEYYFSPKSYSEGFYVSYEKSKIYYLIYCSVFINIILTINLRVQKE